MMTNIQRLKSNTIQNGLLINADDLNVELNQLVNKANELDDALYQNKTLTGNKTFNGSATFQQDVTLNGTLTLNASRQLLQWGNTETGTSKNVFEISPTYAPNPLPEGYLVSFKVNETPDLGTALSLKVGANTALPIVKKQGQALTGQAVVHGEVLTVQKVGSCFWQVGAVTLPLGYLHTPVPRYVSARTINLNGEALGRSQSGLRDLGVNGNITINMDTTGLNGLAPTSVLSPNTWYYLYLVDSGSSTTPSAGYVLHSASGTTNFTIATLDYHARQLPLAVKTDASSNLVPFKIRRWNSRESEVKWLHETNTTMTWTAWPTFLAQGSTNLVWSTVDASAWCPVGCSDLLANLWLSDSSFGNGLRVRPTGSGFSEGYQVVGAETTSGNYRDNGRVFDQLIAVNSARQFDYRSHFVPSGTAAIMASGYVLNL
jgi:hypothetical protein